MPSLEQLHPASVFQAGSTLCKYEAVSCFFSELELRLPVWADKLTQRCLQVPWFVFKLWSRLLSCVYKCRWWFLVFTREYSPRKLKVWASFSIACGRGLVSRHCSICLQCSVTYRVACVACFESYSFQFSFLLFCLDCQKHCKEIRVKMF